MTIMGALTYGQGMVLRPVQALGVQHREQVVVASLLTPSAISDWIGNALMPDPLRGR